MRYSEIIETRNPYFYDWDNFDPNAKPEDIIVDPTRKHAPSIAKKQTNQTRQRVDPSASLKILAYAQDFPPGKIKDLLLSVASRAKKNSLKVSLDAVTRKGSGVGLRSLIVQHLEKALHPAEQTKEV
jgi:hypothetical protein